MCSQKALYLIDYIPNLILIIKSVFATLPNQFLSL